ncbi:MAG: oligosaccharide flippase family protein [Thermodesulfobacteriota bacterium]
MNAKKIGLNSLANVIRLVANVGVAFFMTPFLVRHLGKAGYGVWDMVLSAVGYVTLMDIGLAGAVVKYVAEFRGRSDEEGLSAVVETAFTFYLAVALLGAAALGLFLWLGFSYLTVESVEPSVVRWVLLLMGLDALVCFVGSVFSGILAGAHRYYVTSTLEALFRVLTAATVWVGLKNDHGLIFMAVANLSYDLVKFGFYYVECRFRMKMLSRFRLRLAASHFHTMLTFGVKSLLVSASGRLYLRSHSLIIGYLMSAAAVPFYAVPANLAQYARNLLWALTMAFLPLFSDLSAKKEEDLMRKIFLNYSRYTCMIFFPVIVVMLAMGQPFLLRWIGPSFARQGGPVLFFLTLALLVSAFQPLSERVLTGVARHGLIAWTRFFSAALFLGLGVVLTRTHGLTGLAFAFFCGAVGPPSLVLLRSLSIVKVSLAEYLRKSLLAPFCVAIVCALALWAVSRAWPPRGYPAICLQSAGGLFLYTGLAFLLVLDADERRVLVRGIGRRLSRR